MILLEHPHLTIEFKNIPCRYVIATWRGAIARDQYRESMQTILQCLRENDVAKMLCDIRQRDGLSEADLEFEFTSLSRHAIRHGRVHHATVLPSATFLKFSAENFDRHAQGTYIHQFFSDEREALAWLVDVDQPLNSER